MNASAHGSFVLLTRYDDTARAAAPIVRSDGEPIPLVRITCKLRCECGVVYLLDVLFIVET